MLTFGFRAREHGDLCQFEHMPHHTYIYTYTYIHRSRIALLSCRRCCDACQLCVASLKHPTDTGGISPGSKHVSPGTWTWFSGISALCTLTVSRMGKKLVLQCSRMGNTYTQKRLWRAIPHLLFKINELCLHVCFLYMSIYRERERWKTLVGPCGELHCQCSVSVGGFDIIQ